MVDSFNGADTKELIAQISDLLQRCKVLARSIKSGYSKRHLPHLELDLTFCSREIADAMVELYFCHFESTHRILHVPTFRTQYNSYWAHPESATTDMRLKILLVIGIGSRMRKHGEAHSLPQKDVQNWIYAAQMWLSGPSKKDRFDITGLQIHCLMILTRQFFTKGGELTWIDLGSLVNRAMQTGLHRDPKHLPGMSLFQAEQRRRTWATILELVVQSALDASMPPRISFDEFDTEAPSNINDDEIDESTTVLQAHPRSIHTTTSMQLLLLDALPVRLRVLQLLNGIKSKISYLEILALSSEITDAYRACRIPINGNEEDRMTQFHRDLLHFLVRRFMIALHCPFYSKARTNPFFHYSLTASFDAAMSIISYEPNGSFSHLMATGGGLFAEGPRSASTVISLELLAQIEIESLDGTLQRKSEKRDLLKKTLKDLISFSLERIRQGETNIKFHMFLSMILAQAESLEAGTPHEIKIAQSARDSLELCYGVLQTRMSAISSSDEWVLTSPDSGHDSFMFDTDLDFFFPSAMFS
jgi:hypothetical protein